MTHTPPATPTVSINVGSEQSPFGVEAQIQELKRRLSDVENEIFDLKTRQSALQARDASFESKLAELIVAKESLESTLRTIERKFQEFQDSIQTSHTDLKRSVDGLYKVLTWRAVAAGALLLVGGALIEVVKQALTHLK